MLEGLTFRVARELPSACEEESKWAYNVFCVTESSKGKRQHDDEGEASSGSRKSWKLSKNNNSIISLSESDQSDSRKQEDQVDTCSLITQIGRDASVKCLLHSSRSDYGSLAMLNRSFRALVRSGELYRLRREEGIVEHWVYFSCNLFKWEAFDPIRCRWMRLPTMEGNECFMWSDKESLAVGTELLVFGKEIDEPVVYKYSILINSWTPGARTNTPRCLFGSASLGVKAIVAGGCGPSGNILKSAELYDSVTGTWETLPNMNKPRKMCSGVFMDEKFYVIGGIGEVNNELTCADVYDLKAKKWTVIPNMFPVLINAAGQNGPPAPATAKAPPLLAVVKNELYAAYYEEQEVRKYDKVRNVWVTVGRLPERAGSMNGWGLAFRACGDQLVVIGGPRSSYGGIIELNAWVPDGNSPQWNLLARKHSPGFVYNCAVMGC